jgi:prepilin-type N-terminal cleavage/methylation domain-containing protein/prepilin-type processing-associated H-X9-DG protein
MANRKKAFTLIEVIFVIAIIAILIAILLPGISAIKQNAWKLRDASNLKRIAEAWRKAFVTRESGKQERLKNLEKLNLRDWLLASLGYDTYVENNETRIKNVGLNDPGVFVSPGDKLASKVAQSVICETGRDDGFYYDGYAWEYAPGILGEGAAVVFSYCLVTGLPGNVPLDITPIAFTRGLKKDGTWDETVGLYGSSGGYVAFCDGHVAWYDGSQPARFLKCDKSGYTSNIMEVPRGIGIDALYFSCDNGPGGSPNKSAFPDVILHEYVEYD